MLQCIPVHRTAQPTTRRTHRTRFLDSPIDPDTRYRNNTLPHSRNPTQPIYRSINMSPPKNRLEKPDFNTRHAVTSRSFKNFYFQINPRPPVQKPRDRSGARTKIETPTRSNSPKTYRYRKPTRKTRHHHTTHRRTTLLQISIFRKISQPPRPTNTRPKSSRNKNAKTR